MDNFLIPMRWDFLYAPELPEIFPRRMEAQRIFSFEVFLISDVSDQEWGVKLTCGTRLKRGWANFSVYHHLREEDVLLMMHLGNLKFDVVVFDGDGMRVRFEFMESTVVRLNHGWSTMGNVSECGSMFLSNMLTSDAIESGKIGIPRRWKQILDLNHMNSIIIVLKTEMSANLWYVDVDHGLKLGDGWADFSRSHSLAYGDQLVFRHLGDLMFEVTIFDSEGINVFYGNQDERGDLWYGCLFVSRKDYFVMWDVIEISL